MNLNKPRFAFFIIQGAGATREVVTAHFSKIAECLLLVDSSQAYSTRMLQQRDMTDYQLHRQNLSRVTHVCH